MAYFPNVSHKDPVSVGGISPPREFYSSEEIRELDCHYNIICSNRSSGKTYDAGLHAIKEFWETCQPPNVVKQSAWMRRWGDDIQGFQGASTFNGLVHDRKGNNRVKEITGGRYNNIKYKDHAWYLAKTTDNSETLYRIPFMYSLIINGAEHEKGREFPFVKTVYYDEFIPLDGLGHCKGEARKFFNNISTVLRVYDDDFKIFMMGNTINRYDMYFSYMGLHHVKYQEQGTIEVYNIGNSGLRVAVELCSPSLETASRKETAKFFSFNNPDMQMINNGAWIMELYPLAPIDIVYDQDVVGMFYVALDDSLLEADIVVKDDSAFIFVHRKTTPIKNDDDELIYAQKFDHRPNWRYGFGQIFSEPEKIIWRLIQMNKIFFADNETGDAWRCYKEWSDNMAKSIA